MKLYTEEQVRQIASTICLGRFDFNDTPDDLVNELTPIELPSDEEIWEKIEDSAYSLEYDTGFAQGVKWVLKQIKQQDNEQ